MNRALVADAVVSVLALVVWRALYWFVYRAPLRPTPRIRDLFPKDLS